MDYKTNLKGYFEYEVKPLHVVELKFDMDGIVEKAESAYEALSIAQSRLEYVFATDKPGCASPNVEAFSVEPFYG